jgi:hypothetical protein
MMVVLFADRMEQGHTVKVVLTGLTARLIGGAELRHDPGFEGMAMVDKRTDTSTYKWEAWVTPNGYIVRVSDFYSGFILEYQGATFNVGLEVAVAIRKVVF